MRGGNTARWFAVSVALLCGLSATPAVAEKAAVDYKQHVRFPQARIDRVDLSKYPQVRVLLTALGKGGAAIKVEDIPLLEVVNSKRRSAEPLASFEAGVAPEGREDATLQVADKAKLKRAIVFVVMSYQNDALRTGSLGPAIKDAVTPLIKGAGKEDRINVLTYSDRFSTFLQLNGHQGKLADVEFMRRQCMFARHEALSGLDVTLGPKKSPDGKPMPAPAPGTDLCGLTADAKTISGLYELQAFQGFFPRLFNLGRPFFDHKRYCMPPKEALKIWGQLTPENNKANMERREQDQMTGRDVAWQTSAFDEAMRVLLRDGRDDEEKIIVLVSDGADGYRNEGELCRRNPPPRCAAMSSRQKRRRCVRNWIDGKLKNRQGEFRDRARHWIGTAKAFGIRVFSLGLAMGDGARQFQLQRLEILANKTGGTYRQANTESGIAEQAELLAAELYGQLVVDFTVQEPEEFEETLPLKVKLKAKVSASRARKLRTAAMLLPLPETIGWLARGKDFVLDAAAEAQEALGYDRYVIVGIVVLVFATLLFLLISFLLLRLILRFARRRSDADAG